MLWKNMFAVLCVVTLCGLAVAQPAQQPPAAGGEAEQPQVSPAEVITFAETMMKRAIAARDTGQQVEAEQMFTRARDALMQLIKVDQRNVAAQALLGELLYEMGNYTDARALFKQVLEMDPGNYRANFGMGQFYVLSRFYRQAMGYLETAQRVAPPGEQIQVLRLLAQAYMGQGERDKAVSTARQAVSADQTDIDSQKLLVEILVEDGRPASLDQALVEVARLVQLATRTYQEQPSEATRLQDVYESYEMNLNVLRSVFQFMNQRDARGQVTDQLTPGLESEAARILAEVARVSEVLANLRVELTYHDMVMLLERAAEYEPNHTGHLLNLAQMYRATRQVQKAVETLQKVLAIQNPSDDSPEQAEANQQTARKELQELGAPATAPAGEDAPGGN